jgi:Exostosin family
MKVFVPTAAECKLITIYDSSIKAFRKHNANNGVTWISEPRTADIIVLFEEWDSRFWQYSNILAEDSFFRTHWDRIVTINCDDLGRGFLPGCYTSLTRRNFESELHRACAYPYTYNELVEISARQKQRSAKWLFSFRGTDLSHPIRKKLFRCFSTHPRARMVRTVTRFHSHSSEEKQEYVDDILSSSFVLCPRGWSPVTYRLFEVMELGRCPVIISDDWVPIQGVPWEQCCIVIKEGDIPYCADILAQQEPNAEGLGRTAREVWESHFAESKKFRAMLESILELWGTTGGGWRDYRERWSSWHFHYSNEWLPHQRLAGRIKRELDAVQNSLRSGLRAIDR